MSTIDWTSVEEAEAEGTPAAQRLALLEAAKIFEQRMREEHIPGKTTEEKFAAVQFHLTRPVDAERAHKYIARLRFGATGALTKERASQYLQAFRQAVADLNDLGQSRDSFIGQMKVYFGLVKGKQAWLIRILIGLGAFFLLVLFLADTTPGQVLVTSLVGFVHIFFNWIIGLLIAIALLVFVVVGTALYLDRRGGKVTVEDDE